MKRLWEKIVALAGSNFGLKVLALVIAVGLWLAGHRDIERSIEVPVEFRNIPSDLMVIDNRIDYVVVRLTGPRTLVSTINSDELKLALDLNGAKPGSSSYPLGPNAFSLPRGVQVARITPPVISLRLEPVAKRSLPVTVRFSGKPPFGYVVSGTVVVPEFATVQGPADEVRRLLTLETVAIDLDEIRGTIKRMARLASDGKPFTFTPDQVDVSITLEEEIISREFSNINVRANGFSGKYTVNPKTVYLRLTGPKRILSPLVLGAEQVSVNLKGLSAGEHSVPLDLNLPPEVKVAEQRPQRVKIRIIEPAA
jgi:YbbR domain-containing protein